MYLDTENKKITNHLKSTISSLVCAKISKGIFKDKISSRDRTTIFFRYVEKIEAYGLISNTAEFCFSDNHCPFQFLANMILPVQGEGAKIFLLEA